MNNLLRLQILAVAPISILVSACATSPTGRKQFLLVPDSQMNQVGATGFQDLKKQTPQESDPSINNYVKCVAKAVAAEADDKTGVKDWEVVVFRDPTANAFALPGGKIGVHTGLLPVAKTPGQLAAVLGHEVGHVVARHGNERVSQGVVLGVGQTILAKMTESSESRNLILGLAGAGAVVGVVLPFGRTQESESDVVGLDLMARAGFDPRESVELWKNMTAAAGGSSPPEFLSTHPSGSTRIDNLNSHMKDALATYERAKAAGKNPGCHQ